MTGSLSARVTVVIDPAADERARDHALASISEPEPVATLLGTRAEVTETPFSFELAANEELAPGSLARMATSLERASGAAGCVARARTLAASELLRTVPSALDPFRLVYSNEYPAASLFRREALVEAGGWRRLTPELDAQSDWSLWIALAEDGARIAHLGPGRPSYLHFRRSGSLTEAGRMRRGALRNAIRDRHAAFIGDATRWRAASPMGALRKRLFPLVYGDRRHFAAEARVKALLDRTGVWTQSAPLPEAAREQIDDALYGALEIPHLDTGARVAVILPCFNEGRALRRAICSLREPQPVHLIVVDDASTDGETMEVLDSLEGAGVPVVRHEVNRGVSAARMSGLERIEAPFVFPLDADDVLVPGALSAMLETLEARAEASACVADYIELAITEASGGAGAEPLMLRRGATREEPLARLDEVVLTRLNRRSLR